VPEDPKFVLSVEAVQRAMRERSAARAARSASVTLLDDDGNALPVPEKEDPLLPVHLAMDELVTPAFVGRADTVEVQPGKDGGFQVRQLVDGVRYQREPLDAQTGSAVIDYLKKAAGLDVGDKRRRQTGDLAIRYGAQEHPVRLRTSGSSSGQVMVLDIDLKAKVKRPLDELGLTSRQRERLDQVTADLAGVVLLAAPADNGRTTTMYAMLRRHDAFTNNIRTLELEQLVQIDGVGHNTFDPEGDVEFSVQVRSMLRRDPSILAVAEIPDAATAKEIAAPGIKGPLIYASMKADSSTDAIQRWAKAVGDLETAAAPLKAIVFQRLLRQLCETCRVAYQPAPEQIKRLGLPGDQVRQLFKASGKIVDRNREQTCTTCGGLGYIGQVGAFEVMVLDDEARAFLGKGDLNAVRNHMRRQKMMTLQEAALRKAIEGRTSVEEVIRVTKSTSSSGKSSAKRKPAGSAA